MDSPYANNAFAEEIEVTFPLLSDWGRDVTKTYGIYADAYKASRRATFLIDKEGRVTKIQLDREALDPTTIVDACVAK